MFTEVRGSRLAGKVCIVTGGGSGIGRAICLLFGREGGTVVAADKNAESAARTVGELEFLDAQGMAVQVDVSLAESVRGMVDVVVQEHGRIDVLVNNAGFGFAATVVETEEADWDRLMSVNLKGVYLGCKYVVPVMVRQGGGAIVNTASAAGLVGVADRAAYCASKGGVIAMTRAMAIDHVGDGVRVNCIAPGTVESPYFDEIFAASDDPAALRRLMEARHPMGRLGTPDEVASGVLYLASDDSSFVTGSVLSVDGGMTAH